MVNGYLYDVGSNSQQWLFVNNALFNKNRNVSLSRNPDNNTFKIPLMLPYREAYVIQTLSFFQKAKFMGKLVLNDK